MSNDVRARLDIARNGGCVVVVVLFDQPVGAPCLGMVSTYILIYSIGGKLTIVLGS
jgi:hypothetical protein